jgi:protein required for attachment to host cells
MFNWLDDRRVLSAAGWNLGIGGKDIVVAGIGLVNNLWILVCDGCKALLLQNVGDRTCPKFETRQAVEHETPPTHELGTDKPGTIHSSSGSRRASAEPTDLHALAEREFLIHLVRRLDQFATEHKIKNLVVVAPPHALGTLREAMPRHLHALVRAEVDKDYVSLPLYEIERHLAKALAE